VRRLLLRAAVAMLLPAVAAAGALAAKEPLDPAGALLVGKEKQRGFGRTPVSLHLAPDGTAAGSFVDPSALAIAWTGNWTVDLGTLTVDLVPIFGSGDPIRCDLRLTPSKAVGTITRLAADPIVSRTKLKLVHPPRRPKGWTAVTARVRDTGGTAAGDFRGTVILRNLAPPGKKPLRVTVQVVGDGGMPGLPQERVLAPGEMIRFDGGAIPALPIGIARPAFQIVFSGKKGFDPGNVEILAYEEALRGPFEPSTSGAALPVHWVRALKRKELAQRETAALAAPWFRDDGGSGALPRATRLVLRDLSPFTGDAPAGAVRVSVRDLAGVEVGAGLLPLPRGAAAEVRLLDLVSDPGDLPGGEGQVRVTAAGGGGLPRGAVSAVLVGTVTQSSVPVSSVTAPLRHPAPAGASAPIAFPLVRATADGSAEARLRLLSLAPDARVVPVEVRALDGTLLHGADVAVAPGETARVDPEALGMDLADLPGGEGQVIVGAGAGLPTDLFLAQGELREAGAPDTFFSLPAEFETPRAPGEPVRLDLLDALETTGSDPGDRDAFLAVRNGGAEDAQLTLRGFGDTGVPLPGELSAPVTVPAGASVRISVEQALILLGIPVDPGGSFRGCLVLEGTAGGPLSATAIQYRFSVNARGGLALPVAIR